LHVTRRHIPPRVPSRNAAHDAGNDEKPTSIRLHLSNLDRPVAAGSAFLKFRDLDATAQARTLN
jgi:hypothetical protein